MRWISRSPPDRPSNTLSVVVEGIDVEALVDTGASISIIREDVCSKLRKVRTTYPGPSLRGANNAIIQPSGLRTARVSIAGIRHHIQLAVLPSCVHQMILGWDFLKSASAVISCKKLLLRLTDADLARVSDSPELRLVAASCDFPLPPGQEVMLSVHCEQILDGDVFITPTGKFSPRGLLVLPCLIRVSRGTALLVAQKYFDRDCFITSRRDHCFCSARRSSECRFM